MANGSQKAALMAAKDDLLAAYTSVHSSLGRLISLVQFSEPGTIAQALGSEFDGHPRNGNDAGPRFTPVPNSASYHASGGYPPQHAYQPHKALPKHSRASLPNDPSAALNQAQLESEEEEEEDYEALSEDGHHPLPHHQLHQQFYSHHPSAPLPPPNHPEPPSNGKKGRERKIKRERDPNAPKRPASAYILFQNAVRQEMRAANPNADYKELARQIGDRWKNLSEEDKRPWSEAGKQAMSSWNIQNKEYKNLHPESTSPHTHSQLGGVLPGQTLTGVPRKKRLGSQMVEYDGAGNPVKKKRGRPSKSDKAEAAYKQASFSGPSEADKTSAIAHLSMVKSDAGRTLSGGAPPAALSAHPFASAPPQVNGQSPASDEEDDEEEDEEEEEEELGEQSVVSHPHPLQQPAHTTHNQPPLMVHQAATSVNGPSAESEGEEEEEEGDEGEGEDVEEEEEEGDEEVEGALEANGASSGQLALHPERDAVMA